MAGWRFWRFARDPDEQGRAAMIMVVGLGNPGKRYEATRHNLGFRVLDRLAGDFGITAWKTQQQALVARGRTAQHSYLLVKPQTYMNRSGDAVGPLLRYYKVPVDHCLVLVDDLDLPLGRIRTRQQGSHGGHNGLRSVIAALGDSGFKRIRIGIGAPGAKRSAVQHVLGDDTEEAPRLEEAVAEAARLATEYIETLRFENWSSA